MAMFDWLVSRSGKARFVGTQLGADDEPHNVIAVELGTDGVYFGDFDTVYESDRTHYNVEIISFGYNSKNNVGNRHPAARATFSASGIKSIRGMISALILTYDDKPFPLQRGDRFRREVSFRDGWIIREGRPEFTPQAPSTFHRVLHLVMRKIFTKTRAKPFRKNR